MNRNSVLVDQQKVLEKLQQEKNEVLVWGTGTSYQQSKEILPKNIVGFVDNNEQMVGKLLNGIPVYSPESVKEERFKHVIIIICSSALYEIEMQLQQLGKYEYISINDIEVSLGTDFTSRAKQFWDQKKEYKGVDSNHWLSNPLNVEIMNAKIAERESSWLKVIMQKYFQHTSNLKVLSIGCGTGALERQLLELVDCQKITAIDFSTQSLKVAKRKAKENGYGHKIDYINLDLNIEHIPMDEYDLIIAEESLHHIEALEQLFMDIKKYLKKDGKFIYSEFVGPNRFQWTDQQLNDVNGFLNMLSEDYKIRDQFRRPYISEMLASDPSEAVRSEDIVPLTYEIFTVNEHIFIGGNIMHLLYQCLNTELFEKNRTSITDAFLKQVFQFEQEQYVNKGLSDMAILVCELK